jgi:hypothetical protein
VEALLILILGLAIVVAVIFVANAIGKRIFEDPPNLPPFA